jgi:hypothetical protein
VARICNVTYVAVMFWERHYGIQCRPAPHGRQPGQDLYVNTPYRFNYWVQGGVWLDGRQCMGRGE